MTLLPPLVELVTPSCQDPAIPPTVARQAPLSMGFSRQDYWSGLPFPSVVRFIFLNKARKSPAVVNAGFLARLLARVHVWSLLCPSTQSCVWPWKHVLSE